MSDLVAEAEKLTNWTNSNQRKLLWNWNVTNLQNLTFTILPITQIYDGFNPDPVDTLGLPTYFSLTPLGFSSSILSTLSGSNMLTKNFLPLPDPSVYATAINNLLLDTPTTNYRVSFSDVIPVTFSSQAFNPDTSAGLNQTGSISYLQSVVTGTLPPDNFGNNNELIKDHLGAVTVSGNYDSDPLTEGDQTVGKAAISFNNERFTGNAAEGSLFYYTLMHETAHALGLNHTDNFRWKDSVVFNPLSDPSDTYADYADSVKYSIMSVLPAYGFTDADGKDVMPYTLQLLDIYALQSIWERRNYETRSDTDTYFLTPGIGRNGSYALTTPFFYTIWDGGGKDTIDVSGYDDSATPLPAQIDLRQGRFSSIGSESATSPHAIAWDFSPLADLRDTASIPQEFEYTQSGQRFYDWQKKYAVSVSSGEDPGNVAIAYYAIIENATGTKWDDSLIGNSWDNVLKGGEGADKLYGDGIVYDGDAGLREKNTLPAADGKVYPWGPNGTAPAVDGSGDDTLEGGSGADTCIGGFGKDTFLADVVIEGDKYYGGSPTMSSLVDGRDTLNYSNIGTGIYVDVTDMAVATAQAWDYQTNAKSGATDQISSIENFILTANNDVFRINLNSNAVLGALDGGGGLNDKLYLSGGVTDIATGAIYNLAGNLGYDPTKVVRVEEILHGDGSLFSAPSTYLADLSQSSFSSDDTNNYIFSQSQTGAQIDINQSAVPTTNGG